MGPVKSLPLPFISIHKNVPLNIALWTIFIKTRAWVLDVRQCFECLNVTDGRSFIDNVIIIVWNIQENNRDCLYVYFKSLYIVTSEALWDVSHASSTLITIAIEWAYVCTRGRWEDTPQDRTMLQLPCLRPPVLQLRYYGTMGRPLHLSLTDEYTKLNFYNAQ